MIDETKLNEIIRELRKMIVVMDESDVERNIAAALVYLDCARGNLEMRAEGKKSAFTVFPQMMTKTNYDEWIKLLFYT